MIALGLVLAVGCQTIARRRPYAEGIAAIREEASLARAQVRPQAEPADAIEEALTMPAIQPAAKPLDEGARYTLSARQTEIRDILLAFSRQSPYNFVVDPKVEGTVTVDLTDVPMEEALEAVLTPHNLTYRVEGNMVWVYPPRMSSGMFRMDYVITQRSASRNISGTSVVGAGRGYTGGAMVGRGGAAAGGGASLSATEDTDILGNVENSLKFLMSEDGKLDINKESGLISVIDYPENLVQIEHYLDEIMEALHRQVMIHATVVEVTLSEGEERGLEWHTILGDATVDVTKRSADRVVQAIIACEDVTTIIDALREHHEVSVNSQPQIATLNNQPAMIVLGQEEVFFETVADVDPETGQVIRRSTTPRSVTIGVMLSVVPQISDEGFIVMSVHPRVTEKVGEKVSPDGIRVPELSVKEADTIARVREGNTMLIAGLTTERVTDSEWSVPVLSAIPYLGELFKTVRAETRKVELVIFLTPTLIE